jgi:hypothetical protein
MEVEQPLAEASGLKVWGMAAAGRGLLSIGSVYVGGNDGWRAVSVSEAMNEGNFIYGKLGIRCHLGLSRNPSSDRAVVHLHLHM